MTYLLGLAVYWLSAGINFEDLPFWFVDAQDFQMKYLAALLLGSYFLTVLSVTLSLSAMSFCL